MTMTDFDDQMLAGDDILWGGNMITGNQQQDEKSYEDWLKYYGIEDDDED